MSKITASITKVNCGTCKSKNLTCNYDLSYTFNGKPKTGSIELDLRCGAINPVLNPDEQT